MSQRIVYPGAGQSDGVTSGSVDTVAVDLQMPLVVVGAFKEHEILETSCEQNIII